MNGLRNSVLFVALLSFGTNLTCIQAGGANPLGEVLSLLDSLAAKITKEGEAEAKAFKEFFEWCDDASKNKGFDIKQASAKKAKLEATIADESAKGEAAGAKIDELAASIASGEADLKSAAAIRELEASDFATSEAELVDAIETLSRAINVIGKEMQQNPAAFAQIDASKMDALLNSVNTVVDAAAFSGDDKKKLVALVQDSEHADTDDEDAGAPAAAEYKTHSTNILDVLEDMKEKAEEQLSSLRKAETSAVHNFKMLKQSLEDQAAADSKDLEEQKAAKSAAAGAKASAEGDFAQTAKILADAKTALESANTNCMQTAADHDSTVKARTEELAVISEAKKILAGTTGGAETQTYSFIQLHGQSHTASRLHSHTDLAAAEIVTLVRKLARQQHSAALSQLASRIATVFRFEAGNGEDPFAKVQGLIKDLIVRLESEASADATEKAYCDEQMAKTEAKKSELEGVIAKLNSKIDQAAAKSAELKGEVKVLQAELAQLATEQAEMDKIRMESHQAFVTAKAELEQGLTGVRKALGMLREYYGAAAASMLQSGSNSDQPAKPELHKKASGAGESIIGILDVVESDFAKNLAAEETEEADAAAEYEKTTQENAVTKTLKDQDVKYKTQEFVGLDKSISELTSDRETTSSELDAILEYYGKIKERCITKPETYEERTRRRESEIAGLKEALSILASETAFVQHGKWGAKHSFLAL